MQRFCGHPGKIEISRELSVHSLNAIHQIERNDLLYNMEENLSYTNLFVLKIII